MKIIGFALCIAAFSPISVAAKTLAVSVDARSGPWSQKANPKMPYGVGDELPPLVVAGLEPDSGKVEIYPVGKTSVRGKDLDSEGNQDQEVDDSTGRNKTRFPSFYAPKILYPAYAHGLVATFIDAGGNIVGRPFMVGKGVRVSIPKQATGLALGFNDDSFADNEGSMALEIVVPDE